MLLEYSNQFRSGKTGEIDNILEAIINSTRQDETKIILVDSCMIISRCRKLSY